jgi:hypothetical protein
MKIIHATDSKAGTLPRGIVRNHRLGVFVNFELTR